MSLLDDINNKFMVQEVVNGKLLEKVRNLLILNDLSTSNLDENVNDLIVSKTTDMGVIGHYKKDRNKLVYSDDSSYIHELFHVASSNRKKTFNSGIRLNSKDEDKLIGMDEGITDYLTVLCGYEPNDCGLLRLCVELLVLTNGIEVLKPYCENDGIAFYKQFPATFLNLALALDKYYYCFMELANFKGAMLSEKYSSLQNKMEKNLTQTLTLMINFFERKKSDSRQYIMEKINSGYLNKELSFLGVESINKIYPK